MSRKKKPLPILENVTITDCAAEGKAWPRLTTWWCLCPFACRAMWLTSK